MNVAPMVTSVAGRERIKGYEKLRLTSYMDVGGVLTVGYGHTGLDVRPNMTITEAAADKLFAYDMARVEQGVRRAIGMSEITQNQFDALVSFAYNVGMHALEVSTLLKKFRLGDIPGAAAEFARWVHVDGTVFEGLVARRHEESGLFLAV